MECFFVALMLAAEPAPDPPGGMPRVPSAVVSPVKRAVLLSHFPGRQETATALAMSEAWQGWLKGQLQLRRCRPDVSDALDEAQTAARAWHYLDRWHGTGGHYDHGSETYVWDDLCEWIGEVNFYAGRMPEPVPSWRLVEVR